MPSPPARICKGCWQQMRLPVPLRGPASIPFRLFGIRPSRMNPNTCTICELMFTRVMKARNITVDASVLFADLRGFTGLTQSLPSGAIASLLDAFYDECAAAIWEHDGLLNKTIGDAVMAIFNFPIRREDHAACAIAAAREIQRRCAARRDDLLAGNTGLMGTELGVGIGIDAGQVTFGEFGRAQRDITAIGSVVNTAARVQAVARPGQVLVTRAVLDRARLPIDEAGADRHRLKGIDEPVDLFAI